MTQANARTSTMAKRQILESTHLLCVEPSTKQLFSINMGTQTAEEVVLENGQEITNKIKREEYKMDQLLDRHDHFKEWFFQNETAQIFRRQMVPFYLLEMEARLYPTYVDNSNIDESLTNDFKIHRIQIRLSDSIWQTVNQSHEQMQAQTVSRASENSTRFGFNQGMARNSSRAGTVMNTGQPNNLLLDGAGRQNELFAQHPSEMRPHTANPALAKKDQFHLISLEDVSLLTTADKLIKMCEKRFESLVKVKQFSFRDCQNKMSILKFKSEDSYAYGETQLIYFEAIRDYLRNRAKDEKAPMELVLISLGADEVKTDSVVNRAQDLLKRQTTQTYKAQKLDQQQSLQFPPLIEQKLTVTGGQNALMSAKHGILQQSTKIGNFRQTTLKSQKSAQSQIAQRYKNVSIFGWYSPFNFAPKSAGDQQLFQPISDQQSQISSVTKAADEGNNMASASYGAGEKFRISSLRNAHGHDSFLKQPEKGLIPYSADNEILKSCDVGFPLKINLLSLRDLAEKLEYEFQNKKTWQLRLINYIAPYEPANSDVMSLLQACQAVSPFNTSAGDLKKNLVKPFANHGRNQNFNQGWQDMKFKVQKTKFKLLKKRSDVIFTMKPHQVQIQAALYLGCRRISTFSYSKPQLYGNEIDLSGDWLQFYKPKAKMRLLKQKELDEEMSTPEVAGEVLKIDCLPSCARICFNVILLPEPGSCKVVKADKQIIINDNESKVTHKFTQREGLVLGSCQVSIFDESFLIRQGKRECRLWPFESFMPRMVCQGECYNKTNKASGNGTYDPNAIAECMIMQIEFQSFASKVGWRLKKADTRKNDKFSNNNYAVMNQRVQSNLSGAASSLRHNNKSSVDGALENVNLENETKSLKQVKRLLDAYPMDLDEDEEEGIDVDKVLEYRNYIHKMPIFIRLIDFTDHEKIGICYDTLDGSGLAKDMLPEESLALLDGQFGDIKVRIFAVKKLSMLNDSQIALFMPQLIQALKYELFHHSPLAEFLLEKALKNTRVVGHAFYWSLKSNLHWPHSRERFFLILERFLMCCGQFKNDFLKQVFVNNSLVNISKKVNEEIDVHKAGKDQTKSFMHQELKREEIKIKLMQQLVIAHAKYDDIYFKPDGTKQDQILLNLADQDSDSQLDYNSRRNSGKGSSGDEVQQKGSGKNIRADQANQAIVKDTYQYEFNEKTITTFIGQQMKTIYDEIQFGQGGKDEVKKLKGEDIRLSPRSQAKAPCNNETYFQRWQVEWQTELLYMPFAPKNPFSSFADDGGSIFMSKKKPLLIVCNLANEKETEFALSAQNNQGLDQSKNENVKRNESELESAMRRWNEDENLQHKRQKYTKNMELTVQKKFLFKFGDDLRQDNLVLQFFKIMDRLWQSSGDDLRMVCYDVLETGHNTGYIEFIDNATVITQMHKDESTLLGPFREKSVLNFFMNNIGNKDQFTKAKDVSTIKDRLKEYNVTFLHSLAGQCVATYVLGIRDRHPGNFMLQNETGKFFHIDFGHFLGWGKKKLGFLRDREPFILSNELHYFLKYFCQIDIRPKFTEEQQKGIMSKKQEIAQQKSPQPPKIEEEESKNGIKTDDIGFMFADALLIGNQIGNNDDVKEQIEQIQESQSDQKQFELFFNQVKDQDKKDKMARKNETRYTPDYFEEAFEKLASQAFLKIRQNADIFINLLVLMLVAGLDELDQPSISFVKSALFLNVSEEEATVQFKHTIDQARKQWYRRIDNLFHVFNDRKKEAKQAKYEAKLQKKLKKK